MNKNFHEENNILNTQLNKIKNNITWKESRKNFTKRKTIILIENQIKKSNRKKAASPYLGATLGFLVIFILISSSTFLFDKNQFGKENESTSETTSLGDTEGSKSEEYSNQLKTKNLLVKTFYDKINIPLNLSETLEFIKDDEPYINVSNHYNGFDVSVEFRTDNGPFVISQSTIDPEYPPINEEDILKEMSDVNGAHNLKTYRYEDRTIIEVINNTSDNSMIKIIAGYNLYTIIGNFTSEELVGISDLLNLK
ncbi:MULTISPECIES: hypothetical protein [Sutcliffiella]|uniref:DUF4367 domain-containing protein n=1 Tax=Sutcliffiella cohnii TaxID=33932 RepID=A0A223KWS1_9BACI|nr:MULTISPECIES: hypothetical protein [Sutcliffiella]AST93853.1 hypothetical protein BC6307_22535 [Sutcliffiella cohnii]MED4015817.1 hypothetical protein [Sutcliffiella cohnii]WBL15045.1 hypothetical protein O1A01_24795 [Sutcliffiella sp. NC1]